MKRAELLAKLAGGVSSTTFLTGMGVTGTITTAYFAGRASFKAAELLHLEREKRAHIYNVENPDSRIKEQADIEIPFKDQAKLTWHLYIPAVSTAVTTIAAIVMANHEASKKIAALTTAAGISERALAEYKNKVVEKFGDNKATAVQDEIAQDRVKNYPPTTSQVMMVGSDEVLCMDMTTGRYFSSTMEKLRQAENNMNYEIIAHECASLSYFYDLIDLEPTVYSESVGWNHDTKFELTFSSAIAPDNRPCICVDFVPSPKTNYNHHWMP